MMRALLFALLVAGVTTASALARTQPGRTDCIPYDPVTLRLVDEGRGIWLLERGDGARFQRFASRADAEAGLAVYKQHSALCYIGRGNQYGRDYVMEYLK